MYCSRRRHITEVQRSRDESETGNPAPEPRGKNSDKADEQPGRRKSIIVSDSGPNELFEVLPVTAGKLANRKAVVQVVARSIKTTV